jgi:two-component system alkaline phosphatase synthesis response regulator PhoP
MEYLIYSVEDDKDISHLINVTLSKQGYNVVSFYDGETFFEVLKQKKPNMILLDIMLPGISGIDILKKVREKDDLDPIEIIIISAKSLVMDKVDGFDLGADDYIEKPFNILELISRVNAKFRRFQKTRVITFGEISLDIDKHLCMNGDEKINLTNKEFDILVLLFQAKGNVISRDTILNKIWEVDQVFETRTIDMHIKSLRQKLDDKENNLIMTVHGLGYKLNV